MNWKRSLAQTFATIVAAAALIHLFYSGRLAEIELRQKNISAQLDYMEGSLGKLDKRISDISRSLAIAKNGSSASPGGLADQEIDYLEQRILGLEQVIDDLYRRETAPAGDAGDLALPAPPGEPGVFEDWFTSLPQEKQALVQEVYREQVAFIQDEVSRVSGEYPPEPEEMSRILMASRGQLEVKLQEILSEEENQTFLDSVSAPFFPR